MPHSIKLLVVEDDKITALAYSRLFGEWDKVDTIEWCETIAEAKDSISKKKFDAAILDYNLPDGDSFEIIPLLESTPIIFVSGMEDLSLAIKAIKEGAYDYVVKDFNHDFAKTLPHLVEKAVKSFQMEIKLKATEQRYSSLFEHTNDLIQSVNDKGKLVHVNPAWVNTMGYEEEEALSLSFLDIVHPEDHDHCMNIFKKLKDGASFTNENITFLTKSKKKIDVSGSIFTSEALGSSTVGIFRNITEQKKSQKLIEESKLRYDLAVDAGKLGVMDFWLEKNEVFIDPKLKALLGYDNREIANNMYAWGEHVHPEDIKQCEMDLRDYITGALPKYEQEYRMVHKDGSIRWILARGTAIKNEDGRVYRIIGTGTDITSQKNIEATLKEREEELERINENLESLVQKRTNNLETSNLALSQEIEKRKLTEAALEKSKEDYQGLFNNAKDAILLFDPETEIIIDVNKKACEIYGLSYGDFIGLNLKDISKDPARGEHHIKTLLESSGNLTFETIQYKADGTLMHIDVSASVVKYQDKKAILSINRDVTEKKRIDDLLKDGKKKQISALIDGQEMERKRFAKELHDSLGQLLTAAKLQVKQLKKQSNQDQLESGIDYTTEILDLTMQEVRRISHALMPVLLTDLGLVKALDKMIAQLNATKSVAIEFFNEGKTSRLPKEVEIALYRIAQEAINNALKYSGCTEINITLKQKKGFVRLNVEDNGKGMSQKAIQSTISTPSGSGIYNMKERAALINGEMELKRSEIGGLKISIKIPTHRQNG